MTECFVLLGEGIMLTANKGCGQEEMEVSNSCGSSTYNLNRMCGMAVLACMLSDSYTN